MANAVVDKDLPKSGPGTRAMPGGASGLCAALLGLLLYALPAAAADANLEASMLLRAGQHQKALARVNAVLASEPRDLRARFLKGLIFAEQGKAGEAIATLRTLAEDYPELPELHHYLAVIYAAHGQYEKSRAALEKSLRARPAAQLVSVLEALRSGSARIDASAVPGGYVPPFGPLSAAGGLRMGK